RSPLAPRRPAPPTPHTLSLHDALPICPADLHRETPRAIAGRKDETAASGGPPVKPAAFFGKTRQTKGERDKYRPAPAARDCAQKDRKSTRLNSSHVSISYAVFCLKKKK